MKVIVDAFGSDNPSAVIKGVAKAIKNIPNIEIVISGDAEIISNTLKNEEFDNTRLEILDAKEVITNNDNPTMALLQKKDSSLLKAYKRLKNDDNCIALISAGNTGAVIAGSVIILGKVKDVERPTLATILPTINNKLTLLLDCGANVDCKPHQLLTFAKLGANYLETNYNISTPKVALLSVGTEDKKGNALTKETFNLLKESNLNFVGNMEAKTILSGEVDVIVCDGFAGNTMLKAIEGVSSTVLKTFVGLLKKHSFDNTDFKFVNNAVADFMKIYDFNSLGGAVILGVNKLVIKTHGSSNENTIVNAVKQAIQNGINIIK